jgi:glucosamine--fructose-6-phosphate aminotransferase (isomerizing)
VRRTVAEIESQPDVWTAVTSRLPTLATDLPAAGDRLAILGCGTSFYVAQAIGGLRRGAGAGPSDAWVASEFVPDRPYDTVLAISRSGTTTEVVRALDAVPAGTPRVSISAVAGSPVSVASDRIVVVAEADETSVVQTRFATSTVMLLRAHLGIDPEPVIAEGREAVGAPLPVDPSSFDRFVFLGRGWCVGLANEAALKMREAALAWSESYPALEYRHGPISVADERTVVWFLGEADPELVRDVRGVGATVQASDRDPLAELILIQRTAVALAEARGLDPDAPRHLTRSIVLS